MNNYVLKSKVGRFGNNLLQISNAIAIAKKHQGKFTLPSIMTDVINPFVVDFSENKSLPDVCNNFWDLWTGRQDVFHGFKQIKAFDSLDEIEEMRPQILQKYVLPHVVSYKKQDLSKYDVITHIRGGDNHVKNGSRRKDVAGESVQSPVSYFKKIIKDNGYKSIDGV